MRNWSRLWAASLCGMLLLTGTPASRAVASPHQFSGKQLFEGIFFDRGVAAAALPEIWGSLPSSGSTSNRLGEVESRITRRDRKFFDHFRRDITSGDPGLVSDAVSGATGLIGAARASDKGLLVSRALAYVEGRDAVKTSTAVSAVITTAYGVAVVISNSDYIQIVVLTQCNVTQCPNVRSTAFTRDAFMQLLAQRFAAS